MERKSLKTQNQIPCYFYIVLITTVIANYFTINIKAIKHTHVTGWYSVSCTCSLLFNFRPIHSLQRGYSRLKTVKRRNREYFEPLAGKFSKDTRKNHGKGAKTGTSHNWRGFYLSQYDWLKGSHMTKVVWLPNEIDYSYCEFVAQNTPYLMSTSCHCLDG